MKSTKKVIITGTSRGIGYELVKLFSKAGYAVLALSRNNKPISKLNDPNVTALSFDLNNSDDYITIEDFIQKNWSRVDILINNAGSLINKPFLETSKDDFKEVFNTNVFGVAELTKCVIPFMSANSHVVTVSSMGGVQGSMKFAGLSAYSSSKGAVITLTELLAEEFKETGPSFNVLALGAVQTEMLDEAFPGYKASVSADQMANYIFDFSINGNKLYNGKLMQVSNTTP